MPHLSIEHSSKRPSRSYNFTCLDYELRSRNTWMKRPLGMSAKCRVLKLPLDIFHNMMILEILQRHKKAFVNRHHQHNKEFFHGITILIFQTHSKIIPDKTPHLMGCPYWTIAKKGKGVYLASLMIGLTPTL